MKEAERAWRGINIVDQQTYLKDTYLKDQLKWPPRVSQLFYSSLCAAPITGCSCLIMSPATPVLHTA